MRAILQLVCLSVLVAVLLATETVRQEKDLEKRGWKSFAAGALVAGKKRHTQNLEERKRRGNFWKGVAAGAGAALLVGKKRDVENLEERKRRGNFWKGVAAGAGAALLVGKKRDVENLEERKRRGNFWKGVAAGAGAALLVGKKRDVEGTAQRRIYTPYSMYRPMLGGKRMIYDFYDYPHPYYV